MKKPYPVLYKIKVVKNISTFSKLNKRWTKLQNKDRNVSPFLTFGWMIAWWKCFSSSNDKLFILLIYKNDNLIGICPLYKTAKCLRYFTNIKYQTVRFIGTNIACADYLDIISPLTNKLKLWNLIIGYLHKNSGAERIVLEGVSYKSALLKLKNSLKNCNVVESNVLPLVNYKKRLPRFSLNRFKQNNAMHCFYISSVGKINNLKILYDTLKYQITQNPKKKDISDKNTKYWKFIHKLLFGKETQKYFYLSYLTLDKNITSIALLMKVGQEMFGYINAYNRDSKSSRRYSPGLLLIYRINQYLRVKKYVRFHLMRGQDLWKYKFSNESVYSYTVTINCTKHYFFKLLFLLKKNEY